MCIQDDWAVKNVDEVQDVGAVCPNEKEGSDHLAIAAELEMKK